MTQKAEVCLPKIYSLKRTIVRCRKKVSNDPLEPISLINLEIPDSYTKTNKDHRFIRYDSISENELPRILIFGTDSNIEILSRASIWLTDGTFKNVPS